MPCVGGFLLPLRLSRVLLARKKFKRVKKNPVLTRELPVKEKTTYVPYIPPQHVQETVRFLEQRSNTRALLDVVFSPLKPQDTAEDRTEFTRKWETYNLRTRAFNRPFRLHAQEAEATMYQALRTVPSDLYWEAVSAAAEPLPLELRFHRAYRLGLQKTLSSSECEKVQAFQNLLHIRLPFRTARKSRPGDFWITQRGSINRARIMRLSKILGHRRRAA